MLGPKYSDMQNEQVMKPLVYTITVALLGFKIDDPYLILCATDDLYPLLVKFR